MRFSPKHLACTILLALCTVGVALAAAPAGKQVTAAIKLQGGSNSSADWFAPLTSAYKVHVYVPKSGTATNALYRVYPKGKRVGSTGCLSTDVRFPCYEVTIDQTAYPNAWTQLTLNNDPATQWDFVKGRGYVSAVASNLSAAEQLNLSSTVRFENQTIAIGNTYQGGIIFYIDAMGGHGLVAAPGQLNQCTKIQWNNGSDLTTGATATAIGTGQANTTKIINAQGAGAYAATLAANLVQGGYSDWFLPSKDELNLMNINIGGNGAVKPVNNVGEFVPFYYWSSSEFNDSFAWYHYFGFDGGQAGGGQAANAKSIAGCVRAVRAF